MKQKLSLLLLLLALKSAYADTYFVSFLGSNTNVGSITKPFLTLQKGADILKPGDTVFVRTGTYKERLFVRTAGTVSQPAVFINYANEKPIIDGEYIRPSGNIATTDPISGKTADDYGLVTIEGSFITFSGFDIYRSAGLGITVCNYGNKPACHDNVIEKCFVHECRNKGIWSLSTVNINFSYNEVYHTANFAPYKRSSPDWPSCLQAYGCKGLKIIGNKVHENWGEGIGIWNDEDVLAEGNTVYNNSSGNIYIDNGINVTLSSNLIYDTMDPDFAGNNSPSDGINIADEPTATSRGGNVKIYNNVIWGCLNSLRWRDFQTGSGMKDVLIANNTFVNPSIGRCIEIQEGNHQNISIVNNIFQQTKTTKSLINIGGSTAAFTFSNNLWSTNPGTPYKQTSDVVALPLLAEQGSTVAGMLDKNWFKLTAQSPAIAKGKVIAEPLNDINGTVRGASIDIGAWEYLITTKMENLVNFSSISIHPNPAKNLIFIEGNFVETASYQIFSLDGQSLQTGMVGLGAISVQVLNPGVYLIGVKTNSASYIHKFIKE